MNYQLSIISYQLSVISYQLSVIKLVTSSDSDQREELYREVDGFYTVLVTFSTASKTLELTCMVNIP